MLCFCLSNPYTAVARALRNLNQNSPRYVVGFFFIRFEYISISNNEKKKRLNNARSEDIDDDKRFTKHRNNANSAWWNGIGSVCSLEKVHAHSKKHGFEAKRDSRSEIERREKKIIIITYYVILSIICVHPLFEPHFVSNFNALRSAVFFPIASSFFHFVDVFFFSNHFCFGALGAVYVYEKKILEVVEKSVHINNNGTWHTANLSSLYGNTIENRLQKRTNHPAQCVLCLK